MGSGSKSIDPCTKPDDKKEGHSCMTCSIISGKTSVWNNEFVFQTQGGTCKTCNIKYSATCQLYRKNNVYAGKTIATLSQWVNGHRSKYYGILDSYAKNNQISPFAIAPGDADYENVLGEHLFTVHQKQDKVDFNKYTV